MNEARLFGSGGQLESWPEVPSPDRTRRLQTTVYSIAHCRFGPNDIFRGLVVV